VNGPAPDRPSLRDACPADARAVAALHVVSWQVACRGHLPDHYLDTLSVDERVATWEAYLGDGAAGRMVVAEVEAELVGFVAFGPSVDADVGASTGEITTLYVGPDRWGSGAGRALMGHACHRLAADGFDRATLWVLGTNHRARGFYQRLGWSVVEGVRSQEFGGQVVTDYRYGRDFGGD
jgi:ribosomal protein S18 acetylase RimI-like enzyme